MISKNFQEDLPRARHTFFAHSEFETFKVEMNKDNTE